MPVLVELRELVEAGEERLELVAIDLLAAEFSDLDLFAEPALRQDVIFPGEPEALRLSEVIAPTNKRAFPLLLRVHEYRILILLFCWYFGLRVVL